ncbi:HD domain-containing protein [Candidatus Daviesbacteria bacterium]|nr:HD domain-containing protein [Candidatus Daviesbacteria bacterium]
MDLPSEVKDLFEKFTKNGFQLFIVGGAVRDLLLGKEVQDWDFTTDAKPDEILELFSEGFYDNKFGTVGLDSPLGILEITTMRKEGDYRDHRHPVEVSWTNKIEEDLARRDFTVNAMAMDRNGNLVDPFSGKEDIKNKLIKAVGEPDQRFQEDALRLIRAVRIATQLEFDIELKTLESIKKNAQLLKEISEERIRDEFFKLLESKDPHQGVLKLREAGILQIILPEVEKCFGIIQEGPKHERIYDIGEHSLLSLKHCPSINPLVRFAALIHDIGKPDTKNIQPDGNVTFYGHDIVGGKLTEKITQRFRLSKRNSEKLTNLVRWHMFTVDEKQTDSAVRRFIRNVGLENVDDMMAVRIGDRLGGGTEKEISWRMQMFRQRIDEVLKKPFSIADLKVNGKDVMEVLKIKPGPKVGEILNKLFKEVLEDSSKNSRDYLLHRIKDIA